MYMYQFLWHYIILVWDEVFGPWKTKFLSMTAMNVMPLMSTYVKLFYKLRSLWQQYSVMLVSKMDFMIGLIKKKIKKRTKIPSLINTQKELHKVPIENNIKVYTSHHKIAGFLEQIVRISFKVYRVQSFFM